MSFFALFLVGEALPSNETVSSKQTTITKQEIRQERMELQKEIDEVIERRRTEREKKYQ
jgi:hypothetical protein